MAAKKGNKYAEKWTKEIVLKELKQMLDYLFSASGETTVFLCELLSSFDLYAQIWSDWKNKFKDSEEVSEAIKRIETVLEARLAKGALTGKYVASVAIFSLKNNHGWTDKSEVDVTSGGKTISVSMNIKQ